MIGRIVAVMLVSFITAGTSMAENRIDGMRPDAPALAAFGPYPVGVRTVSMVNPGRIDVLHVDGGDLPRYDRELTVEIWYPAAEGTQPGTRYDTVIRDGQTPTLLQGMAARGAPTANGRFPVVILSHGYPGNRLLMGHLGENLASKGYVVASIDHLESTYADQAAFASTLLHRPTDQRFVLSQIETPLVDADIATISDTSTAAVIGYSMGGYGALVYGGAGVTQAATEYPWAPPNGLFQTHLAGSESHQTLTNDPRLKAVVAIGPWGYNAGLWDLEGMAGLSRPLLMIAGGADEVSVYESMRMIFEQTTGVKRHLLTFEHAGHNAAAPIPAPEESRMPVETLDFVPFEHYADPVWDTLRMNNIAQHFVTAFLDTTLKGDAEKARYLNLIPASDDGIASLNDDGTPDENHSYWAGFAPGQARGLRFETLDAGE